MKKVGIWEMVRFPMKFWSRFSVCRTPFSPQFEWCKHCYFTFVMLQISTSLIYYKLILFYPKITPNGRMEKLALFLIFDPQKFNYRYFGYRDPFVKLRVPLEYAWWGLSKARFIRIFVSLCRMFWCLLLPFVSLCFYVILTSLSCILTYS